VRNYYANQVKAPVIEGMWDGHPDTEQDRKKIKAAQSDRTNAAMAWLQLNEPAMAMAELKDKADYISTAESELAEWLSQVKEQADKSNDKIMAAAIDYLLVDGKVTLPAKFFEDAYKSAVAKAKQEGVDRPLSSVLSISALPAWTAHPSPQRQAICPPGEGGHPRCGACNAYPL